MKTTIQRLILATAMASMAVGCTTAYDAYGRPRTVVEPGVAVLGAAAAGLAGYAIANNRSDNHRRHYARHRGYHHYPRHHRSYYY